MSEPHWTGVERRHMPNCESHLELVKSVAIIETTIVALDKRINGSLISIEKHMEEGRQWRVAIMGVAAVLFIQFVGVVFFFSKMAKQVEINTKRLDVAEAASARFLALDTATTLLNQRMDRVQLMAEKTSDRVGVVEKLSYGYQDYMSGKRRDNPKR